MQKMNRPKSICLNYACISNDYPDDFVYGDFDTEHLMASVNAERKSGKGRNISTMTKVPATTLEKILDEHTDQIDIDLLSLDTEGYELNILKGLNLDKYRPTYLLIEVYTKDYENIVEFLAKIMS